MGKPSPRRFIKRTFTLKRFIETLRDFMAHTDDIRSAVHGRRVDRAFAEKIMLAVTQVNGCRYCNYYHTRAALKAGVSDQELQKLLSQEIGDFPEREAVALAFAQHYAESEDHPDPEAWQRVVEYYGEEMARDIMAYIRMITIGNLLGNTFDAFLSRLIGRPCPNSTIWDELGALTLSALGSIPMGLMIGTKALLRRLAPRRSIRIA